MRKNFLKKYHIVGMYFAYDEKYLIRTDLAMIFRTPKTLVKSNGEYEVVLIDVTETPIERPQKTKTL